jgi:AhpD family alkylhydroperoxidase
MVWTYGSTAESCDRRRHMSRIPPVQESALSEEAKQILEKAERDGAPDSRILRVYLHSPLAVGFFKVWNELMEDGALPLRLKELVRVQTNVAHECGYCASVRSNAAIRAGLTEDELAEVVDFEASERFSDKEKAALRFATLYITSPDRLGRDDSWKDVATHLSAEEIVELAMFLSLIAGGGPFVKALELVTWEQACELTPKVQAVMRRKRLEELNAFGG